MSPPIHSPSHSATPPVLHLVIAEDSEEHLRLLDPIAESLQGWSLARGGVVSIAVHECGNVAQFEAVVEHCLRQERTVVYATLDLKMPLVEGQMALDGAGRKMVKLLLRIRRENRDSVAERLEFCLISGDEDNLRKMGGSREVREAAQTQGRLRRVAKADLTRSDASRDRLFSEIVLDAKDLVRRHVSACTFPDPGWSIGENQVSLWLGSDPRLRSLLRQAERLGESEEGGLHLLFAEAGGFSLDWTKLCAHLRGTRHVWVSTAGDERDLQKLETVQPSDCVVIGPLSEYTPVAEFSLAELLEKRSLLSGAENGQLVFVQFPSGATSLAIDEKLSDSGQALLDRCLQVLFPAERSIDEIFGFGLDRHDRLIEFPAYGGLRDAGAVDWVVERELKLCRDRTGHDLDVSPDVLEVLLAIPWNESRCGGLAMLRTLLRKAFTRGVARAESGEKGPVTVIDFDPDSIIASDFSGKAGLVARGRRLLRVLERPGREGKDDWNPETAEGNLRELLVLYAELERFVATLDATGPVDDPAFGPVQAQTIRQACHFMNEVFESPKSLKSRIDHFRQHRDQSSWEHYYPHLAGGRARSAVENIGFTWPYSRVHLYPALDQYLRWNGVNADFHRNIDVLLARYDDQRKAWRKTEDVRQVIALELETREAQRLEAARHVRESHTQPVLRRLVPEEAVEAAAGIDKTIESLLFFNCCVAIAESVHRPEVAGKAALSRGNIRRALRRPSLGPSADVLSNYVWRLGGSADSVLRGFRIPWWETQPDLLRMLRELKEEMKPRVGADKMLGQLLQRIPDAGSDSDSNARMPNLATVLALLPKVRNQGKGHALARGWHPLVFEIIRRIVTVANAPTRLGRRDENGCLRLWRQDGYESVEGITRGGEVGEWGLWEVREGVAERPSVDFRLPVHEVIRVRPEFNSIWVPYKGDGLEWRNISGLEGSTDAESDDEHTLTPETESWLPGPEELAESAIWRIMHGEG